MQAQPAIQQTTRLPTTIGCGALAVWSVYAFVISELLLTLPVFQTLFLIFGVSFCAMSIRLTLLKRWKLLFKQPLWIWIAGILGVCGSDIAYITAVKYAPPAHVDFIDYLWPFLVVLITGFLPREHLTFQHIFAGFLGFLGVFLLLVCGGGDGFGFQQEYFCGYLFALLAALIWSFYTIATRYFKDVPNEMVGMYCGIGAIVSLILHKNYESWIMPSMNEGMMVGLLGISSAFAYLLWNYGTQKGNLKMLGILAYFTPVASMGLLVWSGKEPMSVALIFACILVVSGVVVGSLDWDRILRRA